MIYESNTTKLDEESLKKRENHIAISAAEKCVRSKNKRSKKQALIIFWWFEANKQTVENLIFVANININASLR